ncbi:MAG: hypothetical protein NZ902_00060 [Acidilobaceae archaeon]|nr:hypothetical protein [Acidilobaceae archaeon]MCX8165234.1 hypothetical protein [Acidilobaceae archaeon]MDW7973660.1 hypothetical protein [Sulfolobales archaeon]
MGKESKIYNSLIRVLAFHVRRGNYAYTDILSNALNIDAIERALYDAVRDYHSLCARGLEKGAMEECCPSVEDVQWARKEVDELFEMYDAGPHMYIEFLRLTREIAIKAITESLKVCKGKEGGGSGSQAQ